MADSGILHPTAGRRRREKGPPSSAMPGALPRLDGVSDTESEHSDDSAGEKEAKRQRSEPTTPVSTSSRLPYEYDALMGITRVGTKEAEGFEEDLDTPEYHDAAEEPIRKEETDASQPELRSMGFQEGYGSSSLKECIELLNATYPCSTRLWGRSRIDRSSTLSWLRTPRPATEPQAGPTQNFHEKYRKNTPQAEILESQENTLKILKKYPKYAFLVFLGYFFGIFGVSWG